MAAALALSQRGVGQTYPNPPVGCVIVAEGRVVGRGWTQPGGRPHAEAMAVAQAGAAACGATAYVTLEPCAAPGRGPACADVLIEAGVARVVAAIGDPFPSVDGKGFERLQAAGVAVETGLGAAEAERVMAGFLTRQRLGRPHVTLKLALSLDGAAAMADGRSQWITGDAARAHAHVERARADAILVGRGTWEMDQPKLDVRLPGLEGRSPFKVLLSSVIPAKAGTQLLPPIQELGPRLRGDDELRAIATPSAVADLDANSVLVEGGMATAASFLREDLLDRLLLYRAPIFIGGGRTLGDIGLGDLAGAHGRWGLADTRQLGSDRLDVYQRVRE
jgi:diaminohydroxyphosphoribosylaminopyrimidine deaminase / 5-amino-6-(5-phosphoribosylamino)uracil reductase